MVLVCCVAWLGGGCKKRPLPAKIPKAKAKSEAETQAEQEAIRRVKEAKTAKGYTIGAFVDLFMEATDKKVREVKGYPFDVQEWSASCELPPPQEIRSQRPLTEEERKRLLAGLPVEGVNVGGKTPMDGGDRDPKSGEKKFANDGGVGANIGDGKTPMDGRKEPTEGHHEKVAVDGGVPDVAGSAQEEPKARFVRCEVSVMLGASKEKSTEHLKGTWAVGVKNLVPQNLIARMLMQEATKEDLAKLEKESRIAEVKSEKTQGERLVDAVDAGEQMPKRPSPAVPQKR
jgi:hypothetical protein